VEQRGTLAWCSPDIPGGPWLAGTGTGALSPVHWEGMAQRLFPFLQQVFTTLSNFPYVFITASPCVGVCNGLCLAARKSEAISLSVPELWVPITCSGRWRTPHRNKESAVQGNFPTSSLQMCFLREV